MVEKKPARGRPRDPALRRKIIAATAALLDEGGITAVTMEAVAAKARVGKPTLYREWPNAQALAMAAFLETTRAQKPRTGKTRPLDALREQLRAIARGFSTRSGRNTAMMIAAAQHDSELAKVFRNRFIMARREEGRTLLTRAIAAGALRADTDTDLALDLIYAPLYFRLLIGHGPLDAAFTDAILDAALKGLGNPRKR